MDLHYSQTLGVEVVKCDLFHYLMDLHYSQTTKGASAVSVSFTTLWIYTILKLDYDNYDLENGFTTLWIYTILKLLNTIMA